MAREKAAITHYDSKRHFALRCHFRAPLTVISAKKPDYCENSLLARIAGAKPDDVKEAERRQDATPPNRGVQASQLYSWRVISSRPFNDAVAEDHGAVNDQQDANEKPDRNS
jgi:hypothetical protein